MDGGGLGELIHLNDTYKKVIYRFMTCLHSRLDFQAGNAYEGNGLERESLAEVGQALKLTEDCMVAVTGGGANVTIDEQALSP